MSTAMSNPNQEGSSVLTNRTNGKAPSQKKRPYKVVFESVSQEKRSLRSAVSYNAEAPPGYTFVPSGNPELTDKCKEMSRTRGLKVYIVSAPPKNKAHKNPENISHHIHRIGHHFDNHVVDQACDWLGIRARGHRYARTADDGILPDSVLVKRLANHKKLLGILDQNVTFQQRNQQVRETIRDLFPRIPELDIDAIITRAFEEGTSRVGNAEELSLPRRVQLATVAHIRHTYTDYDQLLKSGSYHQARAKVEQTCLDRLVRWRGEDNTDVKEVEDIFREVIVLDDDSDADSTGEAEGHERDPSYEIVYTQALPSDLESDKPIREETSGSIALNESPRIQPFQMETLEHQMLPLDVIAQRYNEARKRHRLLDDALPIVHSPVLGYSPRASPRYFKASVGSSELQQQPRYRPPEPRYFTSQNEFISDYQQQLASEKLKTIQNSHSHYHSPSRQDSRPIYVPLDQAIGNHRPLPADSRHLDTKSVMASCESGLIYETIEKPHSSAGDKVRRQPDRAAKRKTEQSNPIARPKNGSTIYSQHQNKRPKLRVNREPDFYTAPADSDEARNQPELGMRSEFIDLTESPPSLNRIRHHHSARSLQRVSSGIERMQLVNAPERYQQIQNLRQGNNEIVGVIPYRPRIGEEHLFALQPQMVQPHERVELRPVYDVHSTGRVQYMANRSNNTPITFERVNAYPLDNTQQPVSLNHQSKVRTHLEDVYQFRAGQNPSNLNTSYQDIQRNPRSGPIYVEMQNAPLREHRHELNQDRSYRIWPDHP